MLNLAADTEPDWVAGVSPHLAELLVDHAHCEKKAASTAINLLFRYPHVPELMAPLSAHAREELEHFEQVLDRITARGEVFRPLVPSPYAARLHAAVRKAEPGRLVDTLLVCAIIEARSCERMRLLSEQLPDGGLRAFYGELLASEARHHTTFVSLAERFAPRDVVRARLAELAAHEAAVLAELPREARMHSRAPAAA